MDKQNDLISNLSKIEPLKIENKNSISITNLLPKKEEECGPGKRCKKLGDRKRRCDTRTSQNPQGTNMCKELINILVTKNGKSTILEIQDRKKTYRQDLLNNNVNRVVQLKILKAKQLNDLILDLKNKLDIKPKDKGKYYFGDLKDELVVQIIYLEHETKKITDTVEATVQDTDEDTIQDTIQDTVQDTIQDTIQEEVTEQDDSEVEKINNNGYNEDLNDKIIIPEETIQQEPGLLMPPTNIDSNEYNNYQFDKEEIEYNNVIDDEYDFLYPTLNDPNFNIKIAKHKEFNDHKYDGKIMNIKERSEQVCKLDFELLPHQIFVKNFLSFQTPYNGLLLYHGLGTGKTCSAIGIAEEMRQYMKQVNLQQKILIIASPNVQNNFRLQLFDENKLKLENGLWNLNTCIGTAILNEINPTQLQGLTKEKVISQINVLIKQYYSFKGYNEFANYIKKKIMIDEASNLTLEEKKQMEINNIQAVFNNRLIIIDEVHNIRPSQENKEIKRLSNLLLKICKQASNLRLLLLTATPMYNNYKEIIWITNLLNSVDKRSTITEDMVFDKEGNFIPEKIDEEGKKTEGGKELLKRKLIGYISYVRGENPYTFPYRIYPNDFAKEQVLDTEKYFETQMNKVKIEEPLKHLPIYMNSIGNYQKLVYNNVIYNLNNKQFVKRMKEKEIIMPNFENMETFGYTYLSDPLQSLNIVYPNDSFDVNKNDNNEDIISSMIGKTGLMNIVSHDTITSDYNLKYNYEYNKDNNDNYEAIFQMENLSKYSSKIHNICNSILNSEGIVMVYSQYIDGGVVPIALALEELGFSRYGSASYTKSLFKTRKPPIQPIDSLTMKPKEEGKQFQQAKYVMITGDKSFSPNNLEDIQYVTSSNNKNGENVKVILISKAASEGLDFKNIRQLHILDPWYNTNRIEQTIGRGVRNLSHCGLPFEKRNVEIYLHGTDTDTNEETADMYIYRTAEQKAIQIGKVTRLLKEVSVDCLLNIEQTNFTVDKLLTEVANENIEIELASKQKIQYKIGDVPYSSMCDYMDNCNYQCSPSASIREDDILKNTYNEDFAKMNYSAIVKRIRESFKDYAFFTRDDIINLIQINRTYPIEHIDFVLSRFVDNKNEYVLDKHNRKGYIVNKEEYYAFQPMEINNEKITIFERIKPIEYKHNHLNVEIKKEDKPDTKISKALTKETIEQDDKDINEIYKELLQQLYDEINHYNTERNNANKLIILRSELNEIINEEDSKEKRKKLSLKQKEIVKYNLPTGESNWYKHLGRVHNDLVDEHMLTEKDVFQYLIYHFIDLLSLEEKMLLLTNTFKNTMNSLTQEETIIKQYFNEKIVESSIQQRGIVLADFHDEKNKENIKIFVQDISSQMWRLAEKTERDELEHQLREVNNVEKSQMNEFIGLMFMSKTNQIMFKYKNMNKRSSGALCTDSGKIEIKDRINIVLKNNTFTKKKEYTVEDIDYILRNSLCVLLELLLRHFNNYSDKVWFFDLEKTIVNEKKLFNKK